MTYYWIHKDDWSGQEIIDEIEISEQSGYLKVLDPHEAFVYETETSPISPVQIPISV